jgi:hypothetical protein
LLPSTWDAFLGAVCVLLGHSSSLKFCTEDDADRVMMMLMSVHRAGKWSQLQQGGTAGNQGHSGSEYTGPCICLIA